ncbi:hypothetical protein K493DRAFT_226352 [Basidiobolus meristosporus CBS 931.73]|uniref:O-fucosyltransferase family protein n=1 Tax=Basidiobolus meristosporus CBS 931.73 TaxID=1314790 RepID=A0A1Y1Y2C3_9FUNG|nr:hypothetical protein K493DRAFT_226352 [Basidiobolus meristosporus CBS 931.73]|eukprot:ORX92162.1 hypothetical protein K493DRAFT_226352 [Basidiobolus meristosporus CBS 931.73]
MLFTCSVLVPLRILPEERFLTYLPHSGFHNQRIELENALLLAKHLNRSLILPPLYLGDPLKWYPFDTLYDLLRKRDKAELYYCSRVSSAMCDEYDSWTMLPWNNIYNLTVFQDFLRLHERQTMEPEALSRFNNGSLEGIYYIKDIWKDEIHKLIYSHRSVINASNEIIRKLGGLGNYYSVHARIKGSIFISNALENVESMVENLLRMMTLGNKHYSQTYATHATRPSLSQCIKLQHGQPAEYPIVYLSTDSPDPLHNPNLTSLFRTFPCTFFAEDFQTELTTLQREYNSLDGTSIGRFLVPMVESMVAANGQYFVGTNKSTFSENIRYLHNTFLGRLDPIPLKY